MAFDRFFGLILRTAELCFAAIVAGITGWYLHHSTASNWDNGRFIYTEVVAAIAIVAALVWFIPFRFAFSHYVFDFVMFICWIVAFGLIVALIGNSCGSIFNWSNVSPRGNFCGKMKADIAFTFISAILWLTSALLGIYFMNKHTPADRPYGWRSRV